MLRKVVKSDESFYKRVILHMDTYISVSSGRYILGEPNCRHSESRPRGMADISQYHASEGDVNAMSLCS